MQALQLLTVCAVFMGALFAATLIAFYVAVKLKRAYELAHREERYLHVLILWPLYIASAAVTLALDPPFNFLWGSLLFTERPHEWLFTTRVERHYRTLKYVGSPLAPVLVKQSTTHEQRMAIFWAEFLNSIDRYHVTMYKG